MLPLDILCGSNGVPADSIQHVDILSHQLRRDIIRGKDTNLAALLIAGFNPESDAGRQVGIGADAITLKPLNNDHRIAKILTIQEFIMAFGIYRSVMCESFPSRYAELDAYQREIISMEAKFGGTSFYEYHKAFSARAGQLLLHSNVKVDWGRRDNHLFCTIFAGHKAKACAVCNSLSHTAHACHLVAKPQSVPYKHSPPHNSARPGAVEKPRYDRVDRPRQFHNGEEICNNFNTHDGCRRQRCVYRHVCSVCREAHSAASHNRASSHPVAAGGSQASSGGPGQAF